MAPGSLKLLFDEHFSHRQVNFIWSESQLAYFTHTRSMKWSGQPDTAWIPRAISLEFVIVSSDRNDKTRGFTVPQLKALGARVILVGGFWNHLSRWEKAKWLVDATERLVYVASGMAAGTAKLYYRNGSVREL
jgi:hypothetical protein